MKQKRTYVTLLLIVALLVLGIAYAAYTQDTLTINGNTIASVAEGEIDVEFTAATPEKTDDAVTYAEIGSDPDTATFTVGGLTTAGQTATVTFTVANKTANGVPVTLQTPNYTVGNTTWFEVTECSYANANLAAAGQSGDSTTLTVTVKLLKTVATADDLSAANTNNTVSITLNAVAANS